MANTNAPPNLLTTPVSADNAVERAQEIKAYRVALAAQKKEIELEQMRITRDKKLPEALQREMLTVSKF